MKRIRVIFKLRVAGKSFGYCNRITLGSGTENLFCNYVADKLCWFPHNIDPAPRIESLQPEDIVALYGDYEWNAKGGIIHWTHKDPNSRHINDWPKHAG